MIEALRHRCYRTNKNGVGTFCRHPFLPSELLGDLKYLGNCPIDVETKLVEELFMGLF
jgi:hypothetical protein